MIVSIQGLGITLPCGGNDEFAQAVKTPATPSEYRCDPSQLTRFVPARKLRRIDHFTRMSLLAAYRALEDGGQLDKQPESLGIIMCSGYGPAKTTFDFHDSIIDDGHELASPLAFSHSVHNIPTGVLSMLLGTPCPQTTICQLHAPVTAALRTAALWLAEEKVQHVLLGATDEATPLLLDLTKRFADENGETTQLPVGEGSVFFLLNNEKGGRCTLEIDTDRDGDNLPLNMRALWGQLPVYAGFSIAAATTLVERTKTSLVCSENGNKIRITGATNA